MASAMSEQPATPATDPAEPRRTTWWQAFRRAPRPVRWAAWTAVGLVLGSIAFLVLQSGNADDRVGAGEGVAAIVSMGLGLAALLLAETAAAEVLLAVFMGSILLVYAFEVADHAGLVHAHTHAGPPAR